MIAGDKTSRGSGSILDSFSQPCLCLRLVHETMCCVAVLVVVLSSGSETSVRHRRIITAENFTDSKEDTGMGDPSLFFFSSSSYYLHIPSISRSPSCHSSLGYTTAVSLYPPPHHPGGCVSYIGIIQLPLIDSTH